MTGILGVYLKDHSFPSAQLSDGGAVFSRANLTSHVSTPDISLGSGQVSLKIGPLILANLAKLLAIGLHGRSSALSNGSTKAGVIRRCNTKASFNQRHVLRFSAAVAFVRARRPDAIQ
jgi:hypothetical protein